jgi:hypothetical protein
MQFVRRFPLPALFCALAVLLCELISHPFVTMGIADDAPYILMVQKLAATGHIVYNGWAAPMLGWQLYLGAAFLKLFGYSMTTVRMSTLLVAMALAFLLQRTLVRANISERNATIGTLALVLSPLYLMLSVTFMTDIQGLFAIVLCLYGCLRALQASTSRSTIAWLCFAVTANAFFGTSRQIAWLGTLVMVPSTLWLLRAQRRVFIAGLAITLAGVVFIFACLHWLSHQPYVVPSIPPHLTIHTFPLIHTLSQLTHLYLDLPYLLLPIAALFLPEIRKSRPVVIGVLSALLLGYILLALHTNHSNHPPIFVLEPTNGDWASVYGTYAGMICLSKPPLFFDTGARVLLTILSLGGLLGLISSFFLRSPEALPPASPSPCISWKQLGILFVPFTLAYTLLLIPLSTIALFDRYLLGPMVLVLLCLLRYYQDRIQSQLPLNSLLLIAIVAVVGVAMTHNMFALYRARVAIADEVRNHEVPDTAVNYGWEYNLSVELQHAVTINDYRIVLPEHTYAVVPPTPEGICQTWWNDKTPHIHALYGLTYDPNTCKGPAPFAPVTYSQWLASPATLYIVKYIDPSNP